MITTITIAGLRGIERGELADLRPLTLLTGANGGGKSTVLDALLIGASPVSAAESVGLAVARHPAVTGGARWLLGTGASAATIAISRADDGHEYRCDLTVSGPEPAAAGRKDTPPLHWEVSYELSYRTAEDRTVLQGFGAVRFAADNRYEVMGEGGGSDVGVLSTVHLIDPGMPESLTGAYSEIVRQGRKREVMEWVRALVGEVEDVEILTEADGAPALYMTRATHSVPVSLAGDGVQSFLQVALQLGARSSGVVLIEEPESRQHPRALEQTARALWAAVGRGTQVVASTQSRDLIEHIAARAADEGTVEDMAVYVLGLDRGVLQARRYAGAELQSAGTGELR